MDKKEQLTEAIRRFEAKKEHNVLDYMELVLALERNYSPQDGLTSIELQECIKDALW